MGSIVMCEHGTLEGMYCDDCGAELIPIRRRREAERAVIEAAKALAHGYSYTDPETGEEWEVGPYDEHTKEQFEDTLRALQGLQEVE